MEGIKLMQFHPHYSFAMESTKLMHARQFRPITKLAFAKFLRHMEERIHLLESCSLNL